MTVREVAASPEEIGLGRLRHRLDNPEPFSALAGSAAETKAADQVRAPPRRVGRGSSPAFNPQVTTGTGTTGVAAASLRLQPWPQQYAEEDRTHGYRVS